MPINQDNTNPNQYLNPDVRNLALNEQTVEYVVNQLKNNSTSTRRTSRMMTWNQVVESANKNTSLESVEAKKTIGGSVLSLNETQFETIANMNKLLSGFIGSVVTHRRWARQKRALRVINIEASPDILSRLDIHTQYLKVIAQNTKSFGDNTSPFLENFKASLESFNKSLTEGLFWNIRRSLTESFQNLLFGGRNRQFGGGLIPTQYRYQGGILETWLIMTFGARNPVVRALTGVGRLERLLRERPRSLTQELYDRLMSIPDYLTALGTGIEHAIERNVNRMTDILTNVHNILENTISTTLQNAVSFITGIHDNLTNVITRSQASLVMLTFRIWRLLEQQFGQGRGSGTNNPPGPSPSGTGQGGRGLPGNIVPTQPPRPPTPPTQPPLHPNRATFQNNNVIPLGLPRSPIPIPPSPLDQIPSRITIDLDRNIHIMTEAIAHLRNLFEEEERRNNNQAGYINFDKIITMFENMGKSISSTYSTIADSLRTAGVDIKQATSDVISNATTQYKNIINDLKDPKKRQVFVDSRIKQPLLVLWRMAVSQLSSQDLGTRSKTLLKGLTKSFGNLLNNIFNPKEPTKGTSSIDNDVNNINRDVQHLMENVTKSGSDKFKLTSLGGAFFSKLGPLAWFLNPVVFTFSAQFAGKIIDKIKASPAGKMVSSIFNPNPKENMLVQALGGETSPLGRAAIAIVHATDFVMKQVKDIFNMVYGSLRIIMGFRALTIGKNIIGRTGGLGFIMSNTTKAIESASTFSGKFAGFFKGVGQFGLYGAGIAIVGTSILQILDTLLSHPEAFIKSSVKFVNFLFDSIKKIFSMEFLRTLGKFYSAVWGAILTNLKDMALDILHKFLPWKKPNIKDIKEVQKAQDMLYSEVINGTINLAKDTAKQITKSAPDIIKQGKKKVKELGQSLLGHLGNFYDLFSGFLAETYKDMSPTQIKKMVSSAYNTIFTGAGSLVRSIGFAGLQMMAGITGLMKTPQELILDAVNQFKSLFEPGRTDGYYAHIEQIKSSTTDTASVLKAQQEAQKKEKEEGLHSLVGSIQNKNKAIQIFKETKDVSQLPKIYTESNKAQVSLHTAMTNASFKEVAGLEFSDVGTRIALERYIMSLPGLTPEQKAQMIANSKGFDSLKPEQKALIRTNQFMDLINTTKEGSEFASIITRDAAKVLSIYYAASTLNKSGRTIDPSILYPLYFDAIQKTNGTSKIARSYLFNTLLSQFTDVVNPFSVDAISTLLSSTSRKDLISTARKYMNSITAVPFESSYDQEALLTSIQSVLPSSASDAVKKYGDQAYLNLGETDQEIISNFKNVITKQAEGEALELKTVADTKDILNALLNENKKGNEIIQKTKESTDKLYSKQFIYSKNYGTRPTTEYSNAGYEEEASYKPYTTGWNALYNQIMSQSAGTEEEEAEYKKYSEGLTVLLQKIAKEQSAGSGEVTGINKSEVFNVYSEDDYQYIKSHSDKLGNGIWTVHLIRLQDNKLLKTMEIINAPGNEKPSTVSETIFPDEDTNKTSPLKAFEGDNVVTYKDRASYEYAIKHAQQLFGNKPMVIQYVNKNNEIVNSSVVNYTGGSTTINASSHNSVNNGNNSKLNLLNLKFLLGVE